MVSSLRQQNLPLYQQACRAPIIHRAMHASSPTPKTSPTLYIFPSLSKSLERIIPPPSRLVPLVRRHLAAGRNSDAPVAHVLFPTMPSAVAAPLLFVQRILGIAVLAVFLAIYKSFHANGSDGVEEVVANHRRRQIVDIGVTVVDASFCAYLSRICVWRVWFTSCSIP